MEVGSVLKGHFSGYWGVPLDAIGLYIESVNQLLSSDLPFPPGAVSKVSRWEDAPGAFQLIYVVPMCWSKQYSKGLSRLTPCRRSSLPLKTFSPWQNRFIYWGPTNFRPGIVLLEWLSLYEVPCSKSLQCRVQTEVLDWSGVSGSCLENKQLNMKRQLNVAECVGNSSQVPSLHQTRIFARQNVSQDLFQVCVHDFLMAAPFALSCHLNTSLFVSLHKGHGHLI